MPETFPIPDDLAERLKPLDGHLSEILRLGLGRWERSHTERPPPQPLPPVDVDAVRAGAAEQAESLRRRQVVQRRVWWTCALAAVFCVTGGLLAFGIPVARTEWVVAEIEAAGGQCETESYLPPGLKELLERFPVLSLLAEHSQTRIVEVYLHRSPQGERLLPYLQRPELRELSLASRQLRPESFRCLAGMRRLEVLDLSQTNLSDDDLESLAGLRELKTLNLNGTQVQGPGLRHLARLSRLEGLTLDKCPLRGEACLHLGKLKSLQHLSLSETGLKDADTAPLSGLTNLTAVEVHGESLGDRALFALTRSSGIKTVYFGATGVTDDGLQALSTCTSLEQLGLRATRIRGPGLRHVPPLMRINLNGSQITDNGLAHLRSVRCLQLSSTAVTDRGLANLLHRHASLRFLDLTGTKVTPAGLAALRPLPLVGVAAFSENGWLRHVRLYEAAKVLPEVHIDTTLGDYR